MATALECWVSKSDHARTHTDDDTSVSMLLYLCSKSIDRVRVPCRYGRACLFCMCAVSGRLMNYHDYFIVFHGTHILLGEIVNRD